MMQLEYPLAASWERRRLAGIQIKAGETPALPGLSDKSEPMGLRTGTLLFRPFGA